MSTDFTHLDPDGNPRMVNVTQKADTLRTATAQGFVAMQEKTLAAIEARKTKKGDVLGIARLAGIMAAKQTGQLIPLCHPLMLSAVEVTIEPDGHDRLMIVATCRLVGKTGVEMEALTAVSIAALTIYDMCKSIDRSIEIHSISLVEKHGGASGSWQKVTG
ncbi:MAG: cyclic pyranopterin monophosphate synthase MoaC [Pseudomonadota bacterium]